MKIRTKEDALAALNILHEDLQMLKDGEWVPDDDSCDASMEVLQAVVDWLAPPDGVQP